MRDFFKNVFATIVGIFASVFIIGGAFVFLFIGFMGVIVSRTTQNYTTKENSVLAINLSGTMKDRVVENPLMHYLGLDEANEMALSDILDVIKKAKDDSNIRGIYIRSGYFSASTASLNEIRSQLEDFKTSGKFIVSYADNYLQGGYFLASVSDKIIMNPEGSVDLHGLSVGPTFYKGMLDKLGIEMQIFKVGTYKSAVEPFMLDKMSDANKEQVKAFADDVWSSVLTQISSSRGISIEQLNHLADTLPAFRKSSFILQNNLVDTLLYETEAKRYLNTLVGIGETDNLTMALVKDMISIPTPGKTNSSNQVAILYAEGSITSGSQSTDINDRYLIREITKLQKNDAIKAVVFRVNSGGGSAYASEQIWKAIGDLKETKPVVVSMGDLAASGGYYIACNASKIYAQPNTLTGSIGIFGMFPNIEGLTNKMGLRFDNVKTNKYADFGDITRPMRDDEKAILQDYIERGYDLFLTRCAEGRNLSKDSINSIAQGRIWTGSQALKIGLVDALGGIDDAVEEAAYLAGIPDYSVQKHPRLNSPWEVIFNTQKDYIATRAIKEYLGFDFELLKTVKEIKELREQDFIQARMPFEIKIK